MESGVTRKVLLLLPQPLLAAIDETASKFCMSRLAFIRLALIRSLASFDNHSDQVST
jgi:metal-responsive CopG/Arc/MetJ family transcriptional regulator